jgi:hypothetical protein
MQDIEQTPSEEDERVYALWQSGKTLRVCAREMGISPLQAEYAIDRCLPPFSSASQLRAYKRDLQRLDDVSAYYFAKALAGDCDSAHIFCRAQERRSAISGWSSVNIRLDPYQAQVQEEPSSYEKITEAIMRIARPERFANNGTGPALAPFASNGTVPRLAPSTDDQNGDQNRANSERFSTRDRPERDKGAT